MCFGGGGGETQTVVQKDTTEIPQYLKEFSKRNIAYADENIRGRPFERYGGERIAGYGPDSTTGFDMVRDNTGRWVAPWEIGAGTTADVAGREVTPWTQVDVDAYMSPYIQNVMDRALAETNRQAGIERNRIRGAAQTSGAYGDARHGVMEAEHGRNVQDLRQNLIANLLNQGYSDAAARFYADESNRLASDQLRLGAGRQMAELGEQGSRLGYADAAALMDIGDRQRLLEQAGLDTTYSEFLREWNYPYEVLNALNATAAGTPYTTQGQREQTYYGGSGSGLAQGVGAFASAAGGVGSLLSGLGALGIFSSKEFKEGDDAPESILEGVKALPVRTWQYKPEMGLGTERHIGPYAEDWRDTFNSGDGTMIPVVDAIGVNLQATKELATEVDALKAFAAMAATQQPPALEYAGGY